MVERQLCKLDVRGSSPLTSTPSLKYVNKAVRKKEQIDIRVAKLQILMKIRTPTILWEIQFPRIETHKNQAYKRDSHKISNNANHRGLTSS